MFRLISVIKELLVRELDAASAARAGEVLRLAYHQIYPAGTNDGYLDRVSQVGERFDKATVLGCFVGRELAGCATLVLEESSEFAEWLNDGEAGLRMLGVDPSFQRLGVAKALVNDCLERVERSGKTALVLHTDSRMVAAQHLYEAIGFWRVPDRDQRFPDLELLCYRRKLID